MGSSPAIRVIRNRFLRFFRVAPVVDALEDIYVLIWWEVMTKMIGGL